MEAGTRQGLKFALLSHPQSSVGLSVVGVATALSVFRFWQRSKLVSNSGQDPDKVFDSRIKYNRTTIKNEPTHTFLLHCVSEKHKQYSLCHIFPCVCNGSRGKF